MDERIKSKMIIYVVVILTLFVLILSIAGIIGYKSLIKKIYDVEQNKMELSYGNINENILSQNTNKENNINTQTIRVNEKIVEINTILTSTMQEEIQEANIRSYNVNLKIEIDGKETDKIEEFEINLAGQEGVVISDIIKNITTIRGDDNKEYILVLIEKTNTFVSPIQYYYIMNEEGKIIDKLINNLNEGIILKFNDTQERRNYIEFNNLGNGNFLIQYEVIREGQEAKELKEWNCILQDNKLIKDLKHTYTAGEFELAGK